MLFARESDAKSAAFDESHQITLRSLGAPVDPELLLSTSVSVGITSALINHHHLAQLCYFC